MSKCIRLKKGTMQLSSKLKKQKKWNPKWKYQKTNGQTLKSKYGRLKLRFCSRL